MRSLKATAFIVIIFFVMTTFENVAGRVRYHQTKPARHKTKRLRKSHPITLKELRALQTNHKSWHDDCTFTNKYSLAQRLKKYPFSNAVKILAVSYRPPEIDAIIIYNDTAAARNSTKAIDSNSYGLQINKGILKTNSLIETKELNGVQINKLTDIIFNTNYKKVGLNIFGVGACFNPRNALVFFDEQGKIFDYLEICFECKNSSSRSDLIGIGTECTQKYDLLKKYFINLGIKYGTINTN